MRFFDKTFFKFLLGFVILLLGGLFFLSKVGAQTTLVNINTASSAELQTLNGIGPSKAQAIIDYRTQNGPFQKIEDIKNVSGIGDATYNNIKDYITVSSQGTNTGATPQISQPVLSTNSGGSSVMTKTLSVDGGRDKIGVVGQPIEFRAETNTDSASLIWVFGDGSTAYGKVVTHAYDYPGDYVVVLKASLSGLSDSSRINVKIVSDTLSVTHASIDRIELSNSGKEEINLHGRALVSQGMSFVFPEDTIIKAGQKISFSSSVTKLRPTSFSDVSLVVGGANSSRDIVSLPSPSANKVGSQSEQEIVTKILYLQNQILSLKNMEALKSTSNVANAVFVSGAFSSTTEGSSKNGWFSTLKKFFGFK